MENSWWKAADQFVHWVDEGKYIPYYERKNFYPFLAKLFDVKYGDGISERQERVDEYVSKHHPDLYSKLAGPYGWAVLQILLIQYRERLNEKWRNINEQKATTRLQND